MPNKREHFTNWRKKKEAQEKQYIDTAIQLDQYVKSISSIQEIKQDLSDKDSPTYIKFSQFDNEKHIFVPLLLIKLEIDELLEKECIKEERPLLNEMQELLGDLYNGTASISTLKHLIDKAKNFFSKDNPNKQEEQILCFAFYTLLSILKIWFNGLSYMKLQLLAAKGVNVPELKNQINDLLQAIENKSTELDIALNPQKPLKKELSDGLLSIIKKKLPSKIKISQLSKTLNRNNIRLSKLIEAKEREQELKLAFNEVNQLNEAILKNENKLLNLNQEYFTQLIKKHPTAFELVVEESEGPKKTQLIDNVELSKKNKLIPTILLQGFTLGAALPNFLWRATAPKAAQKLAKKVMPETLDSQSTEYFKDLAQSYLNDLEQKQVALKSRIEHLSKKLLGEKYDIKKYPDLESIKKLKAIQILTFESLTTLPQLEEFSDSIQQSVQTLQAFINQNQGIFVKISKFLSTLNPIFKSNTVKLIENAEDMQLALLQFEDQCFKKLVGLKKFSTYPQMRDKFQKYKKSYPQHLKTLNKETIHPFIQALNENIQHFTVEPVLLNSNGKPSEYKQDPNQASSSSPFFKSNQDLSANNEDEISLGNSLQN